MRSPFPKVALGPFAQPQAAGVREGLKSAKEGSSVTQTNRALRWQSVGESAGWLPHRAGVHDAWQCALVCDMSAARLWMGDAYSRFQDGDMAHPMPSQWYGKGGRNAMGV